MSNGVEIVVNWTSDDAVQVEQTPARALTRPTREIPVAVLLDLLCQPDVG